ncbi:hypothetical protein KY347_02405 [Candidatus Woesearchaeota archaeon]|nr:hypothetical protein [Candidatus Woesearchaeota archaeon]
MEMISIKMQTQIPLEKPKKEDIKKVSHFFIRENYGTIPSIGEPILKDGKWEVSINANYPRVLFNQIKKMPDKVRFMSFKNLGELTLSDSGQIISKPKYYEIVGSIQQKLKEVKESVEKALIKVAADKFSLLSFPDHMFTPIQDILAWLIVEDTIKLDEFLGNIYDDIKKQKYLQNIKILESVKLVKTQNGLVLPGDPLIEIEMKKDLALSEKLATALTYFYQNGYENLETITSFLGPHLILSGFVFRESVECNEIVAISESGFKEIITEYYPSDKAKLSKVPRYLLQLESIDILRPSKKVANSWEPNPTIFEKLKGEEDIIAPIQEMIIQ